ncbi:hypothetical protein CMTB2_05962 [Caminibacter mediatlanticus TB-2]|uniref:Uncharacterized protein n=1 Tax=Caminibacter mediatlanticus TB-2 TaxID=391592 RepID=A0AAI9AGP1_9BACT|nr:hypothetical protein CMTB2_05962 [Caminibacter mediatlanticus TB-2]
MARASAFQAEGRGFESRRPLHRAVAPMVERRSPKPLVGGSSPSCPATKCQFLEEVWNGKNKKNN